MRKIFIFTFLLAGLAIPSQAQTQFKLNQYNVYYKDALMPIFTLFTSHKVTDKVGVAGYFYVNALRETGWGEGLAGLTYTPVPGITLALLGGLQSNEDQVFRYSPMLLVNRNRFSFFGALEFGGARYRWDAMGFYSFGPLKVGAELIRYYKMYAAGPRAELTFFKKQPVTIFYSALWDWAGSELASMFGIYTAFGATRAPSRPAGGERP